MKQLNNKKNNDTCSNNYYNIGVHCVLVVDLLLLHPVLPWPDDFCICFSLSN